MAGKVEFELGVPIPGVILPEEQWARTAIKKLPTTGPLPFVEIFGREAPLVVDIGCGNGRSTLWNALQHPEWNFLAIDILPVVVRYATRRANQRGLQNVRVAVIGGKELLRDYIPAGSLTEVHCYHPQPFYDRREIGLRLITPEFLSLVHAALRPGGKFYLQTDNPAYARYMRGVVPSFFTVEERTGRWPETPQGRTRREIIALRENLPVYRAICTRRDDLTDEQLKQAVLSLPKPLFDADRRLARYDRMEQAAEDSAQSSTTRPRHLKNKPRS